MRRYLDWLFKPDRHPVSLALLVIVQCLVLTFLAAVVLGLLSRWVVGMVR